MLFDPAAGRDARRRRARSRGSPSPDGKHVASASPRAARSARSCGCCRVATGKLVDGPISRTDAARPHGRRTARASSTHASPRAERGGSLPTAGALACARLDGRGSDRVRQRVSVSKDIDKLHFPFVFVDPAGELLYGFVTRGTERPYALYVSTMKEVRAGKFDWKPVFGFDAGYEVQQPDEFPPLALRDGKLRSSRARAIPMARSCSSIHANPARRRRCSTRRRAGHHVLQALRATGSSCGAGRAGGRVVRIDTSTGAATRSRCRSEGAASSRSPSPTRTDCWCSPADGRHRRSGNTSRRARQAAAVFRSGSDGAALDREPRVRSRDGDRTDGVKVPMS